MLSSSSGLKSSPMASEVPSAPEASFLSTRVCGVSGSGKDVNGGMARFKDRASSSPSRVAGFSTVVGRLVDRRGVGVDSESESRSEWVGSSSASVARSGGVSGGVGSGVGGGVSLRSLVFRRFLGGDRDLVGSFLPRRFLLGMSGCSCRSSCSCLRLAWVRADRSAGGGRPRVDRVAAAITVSSGGRLAR